MLKKVISLSNAKAVRRRLLKHMNTTARVEITSKHVSRAQANPSQITSSMLNEITHSLRSSRLYHNNCCTEDQFDCTADFCQRFHLYESPSKVKHGKILASNHSAWRCGTSRSHSGGRALKPKRAPSKAPATTALESASPASMVMAVIALRKSAACTNAQQAAPNGL
mmetsp:Transcript_87609/g.247227  ORF Transcript_87609/g.247227 Transcript_87609/m.247227 type:complete len:167 (+) Transcript_87609:130-630(+)